MEPPKVEYNQQLYDHVRTMRRDRKSYMVCDLDMLGSGAAGTTYTAYVKPVEEFPDPIVLKEQKRNRFCLNEFEALKYLREQMVAGNLPGYFIFMYGSFTSGGQKYLILERADYGIDALFTNYNLSTEIFLYTFYHVAQAVAALESVEFNHGDLWNENVMLKWHSGQENIPEPERTFDIKIIDYDSAFKPKSQITNPSYGGADHYRKKFILGYDLNRFFDSLIYSYESYVEKKAKHKKNKIAKARKLAKRRKNVVIPSMDEEDSSDREYDAENVIYPQEIIDFMYRLGPSDPNNFQDCPDMSGEAVMQAVLDYAQEIGVSIDEL